jgi:hypothetical protein
LVVLPKITLVERHSHAAPLYSFDVVAVLNPIVDTVAVLNPMAPAAQNPRGARFQNKNCFLVDKTRTMHDTAIL